MSKTAPLTIENYTELSRRLVFLRSKWRWITGMVPITTTVGFDNRFPDLTSPATIGCLLSLVRDVYGKPLFAEACRDGWRVCYHEGAETLVVVQTGKTEAEALVRALESAP